VTIDAWAEFAQADQKTEQEKRASYSSVLLPNVERWGGVTIRKHNKLKVVEWSGVGGVKLVEWSYCFGSGVLRNRL
jgi:hypothetical protein